MKKIFAVTVAMLFLYNSMGYFILFEVSVHKIKKEMRMAVRNNPSKLVVFSARQLQSNPEFKGRDDHEIIFTGKMYDIVKSAASGNDILYYCIADDKEQNLVDALKKESKSRDYKTVLDHIIKIAMTGTENVFRTPEGTNLIFPLLSISLSDIYINTPTPPPWIS